MYQQFSYIFPQNCHLLLQKLISKKYVFVILSTKVSDEKRAHCLSEIMQLCKGKFSALAYSHATSRVVQCLLKLKKPEIRNQIFEELKAQIVQLAMSQYGKYFVLKMLKYG